MLSHCPVKVSTFPNIPYPMFCSVDLVLDADVGVGGSGDAGAY